MSGIINEIRYKPGFVHSIGATEEQINKAEKELNIEFNEEYKQYLSVFGFVSFIGHEITGICSSPGSNVVFVTEQEREMNPSIPLDWYVIEQTGIDGIVLWQSNDGKIYKSFPNALPICVSESLTDYIKSI